MIVISPIDCTAPGVLIATNAVDLAAYNAATTYAADAEISYAGRNWISVQAGNIGHTPGTDALWWVDTGPINSLAMFDTSVQTATTRTGGLSWTLSVGRFTAIGLMGLVGQSITITVSDGATLIQTETRTLASTEGTYYSFCFEEFFQTDAVTFSGLLSSPTCTVTISVATAPASVAACGLCVIGKQFFVGDAQYGFGSPIEDRGRHYLDSLDNPVNVERGYSKGASGALMLERTAYNRLNGFLAAHIGEPMLWVAAPDQNDLVAANVFGRYVRAVPVIESVNSITLALEISGYR
jgi:hypothetical protein